jgi:Pyruvate/2-oxoacid:ferredoxin oxidoreductase delta subunit
MVLIALLHEIPCFPCLYYYIEGSIIFIEDLLGTTMGVIYLRCVAINIVADCCSSRGLLSVCEKLM